MGLDPLDKQLDRRVGQGLRGIQVAVRRRQRQRIENLHRFPGSPQGLAAGGQHAAVGRLAQQQFDQPGNGFQDVLAVVEDQQQATAVQGTDHALQRVLGHRVEVQGRGQHAGNQVRRGHRRQVDEAAALGELVGQGVGDRQGDSGLADAAGAGQGHETSADHLGAELADHLVAADDRRHQSGQFGFHFRFRFDHCGTVVDAGVPAAAILGNGRDKPIAATRHRRDIAEVAVIAEGAPQGDDLCSQVAFLDDHLRPGERDQLGLLQQLSRSLDHGDQQGQGPAAQGDRLAIFQQQMLSRQQGEGTETDRSLLLHVAEGNDVHVYRAAVAQLHVGTVY